MTAHSTGASGPSSAATPPGAAAGSAGIVAGGTGHAVNGTHKQHPQQELVELIVARRFAATSEFQRCTHAYGPATCVAEKNAGHGYTAAQHGSARRKRAKKARSQDELVDYLFLSDLDGAKPEEVFERLRWGGQVIFVSRDRRAVQEATQAFATWRREETNQKAWLIEQAPATERKYLWNLRFLGWRTPVHYMVARKVMLVPPGRSSDRFTYHVYLEKNATNGRIEVVKEVPTVERVLGRLREKFPDADEETLRRRARKFTEKIFPVFLTRETAMLKLLQRDLPAKFRHRVPHVISAETDEIGYTRRLRMNWLRNAKPVPGDPRHHKGEAPMPGYALSQVEFARQAAELLTALHDDAGVMHLDLRLDNVVITEHGVGFVDFGSAVRVGEEFAEPSLLNNLFDEMMRTSQIQRMLGRMTEMGQVTSEEIRNSYQKIDKAVDFFYLAVQINSPLSNPDFRGLVVHDPKSREAAALAELTEKILRPEDPAAPEFKSAKDILRGIEEVNRRLTAYP